MSKVTAIISAYYAKDFMAMRLQNLFVQKPAPEIVVVCQAGSAEDEIASRYNVKIIRTDNIPTIGKAWNLAILQATGDYLTTANTDDMFDIGGLKMLSDALDNNERAGLVFSTVNIRHGQHIAPWFRIDEETGFIGDAKEMLINGCVIGSMPVWRKSLHDNVKMFNEDMVVSCDYEMWLRMAFHGVGFYYVNDVCGTYLKRDDSLEHRHAYECRTESNSIRGYYANI